MRPSLLILFCLSAAHGLRADIQQLRCMWREDPATSMVIAWQDGGQEDTYLLYDTQDHGQNQAAYRYAHAPDRRSSAKGQRSLIVRLQHLQPNTVYYFLILTNKNCSRRFSFQTAPDSPDVPLSIVAGGDSRNNRAARQAANRWVAALRPHVVLFGGDMTSGDGDAEWAEWLDDWQLSIAQDGRLSPILVARGNHEQGDQHLHELFDTPHPSTYYALGFGGSLLRSYTLNSMLPSGGEQKAWLEADLLAHPGVIWKIAQYHHPMRPHTRYKANRNDLAFNWAPLFARHGMDLAVECDAHVAKQTRHIAPGASERSDEGFGVDLQTGTVYIGEGCWGAPLRRNNDDKQWTLSSGSFNHFSWLWVSRERLEIRTVMVTESAPTRELADAERFSLPPGIPLWMPAGKSVYILYPKINGRRASPQRH